jgi:DNA-binding response OmpR family regulator
VSQEHLRSTAQEAYFADRSVDGAARRRLLIVDDNRDAAESMATLLRMQDHDVQVAYDGPTGVALALANRFDIVLVDIGLPGIDGHEVARRLRQHGQVAGMVLVALTGYGRDEDRLMSRQAGFDHHLVKPVQWEVLEQLLQNR